jgi:Na+/proline symporter
MFIAYSATLLDPRLFGELLEKDSQLILPTLVIQHMPLFAQVLFFGAVLSAIMSCSSATLLAPSVTFAENIVRGFFPKIGDHRFLWVMRATLVGFTAIVLGYALNSELSIFHMVESAYKITLAGAFVPLFFGAFWKRSTTQGALFATFGGLVTWILIEVIIGEESLVPPQLIGLAVSAAGMVAGSLLPQWTGHRLPQEPAHAYLHHHAAAQTHHVEQPTHHHAPAPREG